MVPLSEELRVDPDVCRPTVMMVEDEPDHREIYGTILWYNGFNVLLVPDAASALKAIAFIRPDLILLDLGLPDGTGFQVCDVLRRTPDGAEIPVVVLSALPAFQMQGRAYEAGCRLYLEKTSTSPVDVLHKVERIVGRPPESGAGATPWMISYPESPARPEAGLTLR